MSNKLILISLNLLLLTALISSTNVSLSDQGTQVIDKNTGDYLTLGDLQITIYDNLTAGNLIYSETFTSAIVNGSWNIIIGENTSNPLNLEYGKKYYKDYQINSLDINFTDYQGNSIPRQYFYSPLGEISEEDISSSTNITTTGWFKGLFNWIIDSTSNTYLSFNGTSLSFNETKLNNTIDTRNTDSYINLTVRDYLNLGNGSIWYNNSDSKYYYYNETTWIEIGSGSGNSVSEGAVVAFNQESCPTGWILADGTNGTPDLRGIFIRGAGTSGVIDYANGTDMQATYGEYVNDSFQGHTHQLGITWTGTGASGGAVNVIESGSYVIPSLVSDGINGNPRTGAETAPASYAMIYCVKTAEDSVASNSIWERIGNIVSLVNSTYNLFIDGDVNITGDLNLGNGTIRWNETSKGYDYFDGTSWSEIGSGSSSSSGSVPENAVMSFNQESCPVGWVLADGSNGTPDLRGIFVRGAGTSGVIDYANGTDMQATYGEYVNDSFQGHFHTIRDGNGAGLFISTSAGGSTVQYVNPDAATALVSQSLKAVTAGTDGINGAPRTGSETAPASYAMIYCVKTAEDSEVSNSIWNIVGNIIKPVNISRKLVVRANGVGIDTLTNLDEGINLTSDYNDKLVTLNSSASGNAVFKLPSVDSSNDGEIYRFLNDAGYVLTIKPNDTSAIWNSGSGYGIDLPDKGTYVELRYDSGRNKWDILQKTGGKVLIEGLVLAEPMNEGISKRYGGISNTDSRKLDKSGRHIMDLLLGIEIREDGAGKFIPGSFEFDGTDSYMSIPDSTDWDIFGDQNGVKTVSFWVYPTANSLEIIIAHNEDVDNYWYIYRNVGGAATFSYKTAGSTLITGALGTLTQDTWSHVAIIIDGNVASGYINGVQGFYDNAWNIDSFASSLYFGQSGGGSAYFTGRAQDLHISYNNPYNANPNSGSTDSFAVPSAPFVGVMN
ncbi:MAG: LamG domain-containing protein [Candidatus Pacearchaeota archaeon]|nr:LamG domain-containing protein [Candidatus Pacearchaeota archaeon]